MCFFQFIWYDCSYSVHLSIYEYVILMLLIQDWRFGQDTLPARRQVFRILGGQVENLCIKASAQWKGAIFMALGKILVVDDDKNICELLRLYLEKEGDVYKRQIPTSTTSL